MKKKKKDPKVTNKGGFDRHRKDIGFQCFVRDTLNRFSVLGQIEE
jgi:hypothetical protein